MIPKKNIFVLGLNDLNHDRLRSVKGAENLNLFGVIPPEEAEDADSYDIDEMLSRVRSYLDRFPGSIDGIVSYIDFPISAFVPILCKEYGVPGPSLESVLKCQHKYWSRVEMERIIPDHIPQYRSIDPFDPLAIEKVDIPYPFWIKPTKSVGSSLGFRVECREDLENALLRIKEGIGRFADPFEKILEKAEVPDRIKNAGAASCLIESIIGGEQCTLEGYMFNGKVEIYGVVDSIREDNGSTFSSYQYGSSLPYNVQERMKRIAERTIEHFDLNNSAFNIEFFWDPMVDKIWLLEINTRISQSHCDLFEKVDGTSHHQVMVQLGLGCDPDFPSRKGNFPMAAKFFLRKFNDAEVVRVPTEQEIQELEKEVTGAVISPKVEQGMKLSDLNEQDSYSFELAWVFLGGKNRDDLLKKYEYITRRLDYRFLPVMDGKGVPIPLSSDQKDGSKKMAI